MAVSTGLYDPSLEDRLRHPIQHLYRVDLLPAAGGSYRLAVEDELTVTLAMGWSPFAQASLTIQTPVSGAEYFALDGRLDTYVRIQLGYALDGATTSIHDVVKLRIQDVEEDPKAGTMKLSLQGREMEAQDAYWNADWNTLVPRTGVKEFIEYVLAQSLNGTPTLNGTAAGHKPHLLTGLNPSTGTSLWSIAESVANSAGLKLWHDGLSTWNCRYRYTLGSTYPTMLRTGKSGTITSVKKRLSRTDWFNNVQLTFSNVEDGPGRKLVGSAQISTGPYATTAVGRKTYAKTVEYWASDEGAQGAAAALLETLAARGRSYEIQAAAAYWIRPGMTVPVKTGREAYERQLVESVTFTPLNGLMTITTIKNEDAA